MVLPPVIVVMASCILDRLVGDPRWCLHPVQVMGAVVGQLRLWVEALCGDRPWALRLGGGLITALLVSGSTAAGWALEQLSLQTPWSFPLLVIALASALAGRSLRLAVEDVLKPLSSSPPDLELARQKLAWIVGRDVEGLPAPELLRATAETASENAVDGLFAPLFWMLIGAGLWHLKPAWPGPLALAWAFKASSTLDSMLGYRRGRLQWLGTAGARLDDALTWLPCRLLALSLGQLGPALRDGASDPSPNAGVSQAAYAHALGLQLGGVNRYGGVEKAKPLLNPSGRPTDARGVKDILKTNERLALLWLVISGVVAVLTQ
jgi:adenosylcobinamide-phosphate synthase